VVALVAAAVVWTGCEHRPRTRPASLVLACGDGNLYADHLRWSRWTATDAVATGVGHRNTCTPSCAAGRFRAFPIRIRLSRPVTCVTGRREFARVQWTGESETLPCTFLKLRP
jgi:hypothetical protein